MGYTTKFDKVKPIISFKHRRKVVL